MIEGIELGSLNRRWVENRILLKLKQLKKFRIGIRYREFCDVCYRPSGYCKNRVLVNSLEKFQVLKAYILHLAVKLTILIL
jgi:hypothetical protein